MLNINRPSVLESDVVALHSILHTADQYMKMVEDSDRFIGTEKFNILLRPFTGTINLIHSIVINFTLAITKWKKNLNRSELKFHHNQNMLNDRRALNAHFLDVQDILIPFPNGMKSTYLETVKGIKNFFDFTSYSLFEVYKNNMVDLYRYLSLDDQTHVETFHQNVYKKADMEKTREGLFIDHTHNFSSTTPDVEVAFKEKFKSMNEFNEVNILLLSLDSLFTNIDKIMAIAKETTELTDKSIAYIQNSDNMKALITKDFVANFIDYVRSIAEAYDMYATVLETTTAVEHNFCKVLERVYDSV